MQLRSIVVAFAMLANAAPAGAKPRAHTAHLKLVVKPADATIQIVGMDPHVGSPLVVDLDPGTYHVAIKHDGFRTYVTTIDAHDGETQTIQVVLDRAASGG
jgi:hypothetical protein